jgi:4-oxalocrotonate tautomerase
MPFVRAGFGKGKDAAYRNKIGHVVYEPLVSVDVPTKDRFQVVSEHDAADVIFDDEEGIPCQSATCGLRIIES